MTSRAFTSSSLGRRSARRQRRSRVVTATLTAATALTGLAAAATAAPAAAWAAGQVHATTSPLSNTPFIGMAKAGARDGYWEATGDGGVFSFGSAPFHGSLGGVALAKPVVTIASTPDGNGYWMAASDGGVFSFGDAAFHGSTGGVHLDKPIVGMAPTPDGKGYWLVASDGGVFAFGDAAFHGSTGGVRLDQPVVGMASTPDGKGYWLVASDGGIFAFGDAAFHGSTGGVHLDQPIVSMAPTSTGSGYWLVARDGGVFAFNAPYHGSAVGFNAPTHASTIGIVPVGGGYWLPDNLGPVDSVAAPAAPSPPNPVVVVTSTPPPAPALPYWQNPSSSIAPSSDFVANCYGSVPSPAACDNSALANINSARASEGLPPLNLPSNFWALSTVSQLVAVANAERTSRGLPALPENGALDGMAQQGAVGGYDPVGPAGYAWGSNIAWGEGTPLAADFGWMYDDGPNSPNIDCGSPSNPGCWGHRRNILSPWGGASGAGAYNNGGTLQLTQLFVENY